jgi:DNA-binding MarR family transcriptional regulator
VAGVLIIITRLNQAMAPFGIDLYEFEILLQLHDAEDNQLRMSQLSKRIALSRSRLTHTVQRMEDKGLVRRVSGNDDGRGVWATLLDDGRALLDKAAPAHAKALMDSLIEPVGNVGFTACGMAMQAVIDAHEG